MIACIVKSLRLCLLLVMVASKSVWGGDHTTALLTEISCPEDARLAGAFIDLPHSDTSGSSTVVGMANQYFILNEDSKAIELLEPYVAESGEDTAARALLIRSYLSAGRIAEARKRLEDSASQSLPLEFRETALAFIYFSERRYLAAIEKASAAIRANVNYAWAYLARAQSHLSAGNLREGLVDIERCIFLAPLGCGKSPATPYVVRGGVYQQTANFDRALASFALAYRLDPGNLNALHGAAACYLELRKPQLAYLVATRIAGEDSQSTSTARTVAISAIAAGQLDAALTWSRRWLRLDPDSTAAKTACAIAMYESGNIADADALTQAILTASSSNTEALANATMLSVLYQPDDAAGLLALLRERAPDSFLWHRCAFFFAWKHGDANDARKHVSALRRLADSPRNERYAARLAVLTETELHSPPKVADAWDLVVGSRR